MGAVYDWPQHRELALSLGLPHVTEEISWGHPNLKAHGKMWAWWSPTEDAPVFKLPFEERDMLCEADPQQFFFTPHYRNSPMVLVRPHLVDRDWAKGMLLRSWRAMAPKRVLKAFDDSLPLP